MTAFDEGGGGQSKVLRFRAGNGRVYNFRSVNKEAGRNAAGLRRLPPAMWVSRDHVSALVPAVSLLVGRLERAAGLPTPERWLAVLPDSPRLGEWREEFAGMLGTFEERFTASDDSGTPPPWPGVSELLDTDSLLVRLERDPLSRLDQESYLRARLFDLFISDPDRHAGQWLWARRDESGLARWSAVPQDRDWALSRSNGLVWSLLRSRSPLATEFGPTYDNLPALARAARALDLRFLSGLDRRTWEATVKDLQSRLTDGVIQAAVSDAPKEWDSATRAWIEGSLRTRRDALPQAASHLYETVSSHVNVRATPGHDHAVVTGEPDGALSVEVRNQRGVQVFKRRFLPDETREVRLHLGKGADTVRMTGERAQVLLRVIPGDEKGDLVADSARDARVRVYREYEPAIAPTDPTRVPRDWGSRWGITTWFRVRPEVGVAYGAGPVFYTYGFNKVPYASRIALRVGTTSRAGQLNADLKGEFRFDRRDRRAMFRATALNADVIRYFGFGNETPNLPIGGYYNVILRQYRFEPAFELGTGRRVQLELGGVVRWLDLDENRPTLLREEQPYGSGSFAEVGATATLRLDARDSEVFPTRGAYLELRGRAFPAALDVVEPFGSVAAIGAAYFTINPLPLDPTFALRVGGMKTVGPYPFFESAELGGRYTFRGFTTTRFRGDAIAYANSELRLDLGGALPGDWGLIGLADIGRVFYNGEKSSRWHTGAGGGVWAAFSDRTRVVTLTAANAGERTKIYLHLGFHF
jgi:hypothetical protein